MESIIPTIYRAYKENYRIVFEGEKFDIPLYSKKDKKNVNNTQGVPVFWIDLQDVEIATGNQEEFLNGIMFHKFKKTVKDLTTNKTESKMLDFTEPTIYGFGERMNRTAKEYFISAYQLISIDGDSLYKRLKDIEDDDHLYVEEHLGTYYQEDEYNPDNTGSVESVPEANKNKKRIITYKVDRQP